MLTTTCFLRSFTLKILGFSGLQKDLALRFKFLSLAGIHWLTVILVWLLFPKGNLYSRPLKISTWAWCWLQPSKTSMKTLSGKKLGRKSSAWSFEHAGTARLWSSCITSGTRGGPLTSSHILRQRKMTNCLSKTWHHTSIHRWIHFLADALPQDPITTCMNAGVKICNSVHKESKLKIYRYTEFHCSVHYSRG